MKTKIPFAALSLPFAFGDEEDDNKAFDFNDPAVKTAIDKRVEELTAGLRTNRDEILSEKRKLSEKLDELGKRWEGLDPQIVKNLMGRFENDEETKLIAEGKVDEVIERRTSRVRDQAQADVVSAQARSEELETGNKTLQGRIKKLVLDSAVRDAAGEAGLLPSAVADAIQRAHLIFQVNDEDVPVAMEGETIVRGKDGRTALTVAEWLTGMKKAAPHWWAPSNGGGAEGGIGSKSGSSGEDKAAVDKLSSQGKLQLGIAKALNR